MLSGSSCSNLIGVLVTNLLSEQSSLQPELAAHRAELSKISGLLNAVRTHEPRAQNETCPLPGGVSDSLSLSCQDLRALVLLLSVQPPQAVDPALCPALQELLARCRVCVQQCNALELEAKDHKAKGAARTHRLLCRLSSYPDVHPSVLMIVGVSMVTESVSSCRSINHVLCVSVCFS